MIMKPRNNQSSLAKKPTDSYSNRPSKTQLDYYDNYPHLVPPYAYNNAFMNPYAGVPGVPPYAPYAQIAAAMQAGMLAPGMMPPGMIGYPYNKKKLKNQQLAPLLYDPAYYAMQTDGKLLNKINFVLSHIFIKYIAFIQGNLNSYANKLKTSQSQKILAITPDPRSKSREKTRSKSNEKMHKTVTYNLDQINDMYNNDIGPSQIIFDETSDDKQQEKIIKKNANQGILKNSDHPISRGDFDRIPPI